MNRNIDWLGIVRTLLVQVLVLLALAGAGVWYLNWSSDVALHEFIGTNQPPVARSNHQPLSPVPVQTVKSKAVCTKKV
jgi:hypothetical protein